MSEHRLCPYCNRPIMRNRHTFSGGLANTLLKTAARFVVGEPFHLQQDLDLTHNEYANFQKLRYWSLAEKYTTTSGHHIGGKWVLTLRALRLIRGDEKIEEWVETFNNEVMERSGEKIGIADVIGTYTLPVEYAKAQRSATETDNQTTFDFRKVV